MAEGISLMNFGVESSENWGDNGLGGAVLYNEGKHAPFSNMLASFMYSLPTAGKLLT